MINGVGNFRPCFVIYTSQIGNSYRECGNFTGISGNIIFVTSRKRYLGNFGEFPQKGRKQAISGAFPSKWINPPVACYNAVIRDFCQN